MRQVDYKAASIAIGMVVSARGMVEEAKDDVEYNFDDSFNKDFNKVWTILNEIVCELNERLDQEGVDQESEEDKE